VGLVAHDELEIEVPDSAVVLATLDRAFREHAPKVATVALRILGRADEADDLVQDVFMKAGKWLSRLDEPAALRAWLLKSGAAQGAPNPINISSCKAYRSMEKGSIGLPLMEHSS
jgi:hypothetical protein